MLINEYSLTIQTSFTIINVSSVFQKQNSSRTDQKTTLISLDYLQS